MKVEESPEWQVRYEVVLMGQFLECWAFLQLCEHAGEELSEADRLALTAYFEAHLLHVRNVIEFLSTHAKKKGSIRPQRWVPHWEASAAAKRFAPLTKRLNTELAHLSDTRTGSKPWLPLVDSEAVIAMYNDFAQQATEPAATVELLQGAALIARACWARARQAETDNAT